MHLNTQEKWRSGVIYQSTTGCEAYYYWLVYQNQFISFWIRNSRAIESNLILHSFIEKTILIARAILNYYGLIALYWFFIVRYNAYRNHLTQRGEAKEVRRI